MLMRSNVGLAKKYLFVDQEISGSIPPNRTNLFNDLAYFSIYQNLSSKHIVSTPNGI
jgi:hypothetical protein